MAAQGVVRYLTLTFCNVRQVRGQVSLWAFTLWQSLRGSVGLIHTSQWGDTMDFCQMTSGEAAIALEGYSAARCGRDYDATRPKAWRDGWRLWHEGTLQGGPMARAMARATAPRVYRNG